LLIPKLWVWVAAAGKQQAVKFPGKSRKARNITGVRWQNYGSQPHIRQRLHIMTAQIKIFTLSAAGYSDYWHV
jgi:hypothetical protein